MYTSCRWYSMRAIRRKSLPPMLKTVSRSTMSAEGQKRSGLHEQIKAAYWAALDEATDPADAERRLRALVAELERPYPSAAACLAEDLPALCIHLKYFPRLHNQFWALNLL